MTDLLPLRKQSVGSKSQPPIMVKNIAKARLNARGSSNGTNSNKDSRSHSECRDEVQLLNQRGGAFSPDNYLKLKQDIRCRMNN